MLEPRHGSGDAGERTEWRPRFVGSGPIGSMGACIPSYGSPYQ